MSETTLSEFLSHKGYVAIQMVKNMVGHFEVSAKINGVQTHLLVDTGASRTVIARAGIERFGLDMKESDERAGGIGTADHVVAFGVIESLDFENFHVAQLAVGIIDLSHVNQALERHGGQRVDGAVGADLLNSKAAVIDYQHALLYLRDD